MGRKGGTGRGERDWEFTDDGKATDGQVLPFLKLCPHLKSRTHHPSPSLPGLGKGPRASMLGLGRKLRAERGVRSGVRVFASFCCGCPQATTSWMVEKRTFSRSGTLRHFQL